MFHYIGPIAHGIGSTLTITFAAYAIGLVLGIPIVVARSSRLRVVRLLAISFVEIFRGIPGIAWLFILYYGLAQLDVQISSMTAAICGLGLIAAAYMAEIYRAGLRAVPHGQFEAARALGMGTVQVYRSIVGPQAFVTSFPPAATYVIGLLKESAVASVIGAQEITGVALGQQQEASTQGLSVFLAASAVYLALSLPLAGIARYADVWLARRVAGAEAA
ncbi:MAG: amino transporter, permease, region, His/Glu/Gln/Arg/opine family domain protein [Conexibacter sp.]|nr:amino transporter, permease, region, His/Glu/Gln/Arg/opine family domain protein [Conexibacter sp.]